MWKLLLIVNIASPPYDTSFATSATAFDFSDDTDSEGGFCICECYCCCYARGEVPDEEVEEGGVCVCDCYCCSRACRWGFAVGYDEGEELWVGDHTGVYFGQEDSMARSDDEYDAAWNRWEGFDGGHYNVENIN